MRNLLIAALAGVATVFAFAPFGLFPLGIVAPAVLFFLWRDASPRAAFFTGLIFGVALFGVGVSWIYVSMNVYGHMAMPLAGLAVLIFVLILSLYPALVGLVQAYVPARTWVRCCLLIPAVWVLGEWLRGWLFSGFPWLSLGYGQLGGSLAGLAQWFGVYGVSWATATVAGLLAAIATVRGMPQRLGLLGAVAVMWALGWLAGQVSWVVPAGDPLKVAVVQGNVPLSQKWGEDGARSLLEMYSSLSMAETDRDLIVWPEAALPLFIDQLPPEFVDSWTQHPADFATGILERRTEDGVSRVYNSVLVVSDQRSVYRKQHLVPFGEFLPLPFLLSWLIDHLQIPMSDFSAWPDSQQIIQAAGTRLGISICYEDAFVEEVRRTLPAATLLINVSEDAWFGDSFAPHQRLDMAKMRALESGRPMIRAGNTGVSAIIDHTGTILGETPQFTRTVLRGEVQPMQGATPFVRYGSWPVVTLCLVMVVLIGLKGRRATGPSSRGA